MRQEKSLVYALLDRSVVFGIGLMIALLGVGAVGSYRNIESIRQKSLSVTQTHAIDRMAADLLSTVTDAVVSQRHYLISGDLDSRKAAEISLNQLAPRVDEIGRRTFDNETQQHRVVDLGHELEVFRSELLQGMQQRMNGANAAEIAKASTDLSKRLDTIRVKIVTLRGEEGQLLLDREDLASEALRTALLSGVFLFGMGLVVFTGIIELIRRNAVLRHRQQERLFTEREQLSVTLGSIADAVISVDRRGLVTQWNGPAETLTGRLRESVVGLPLPSALRLVDEFTAAEVAIPIDEVLQKGNTTRFDVSCLAIAVDGGSLPVSGRFSPIRDHAGVVDGAVLVLRELSEERAAEIARTERARILSIRADVGMIVSHAGRTQEQLRQSVKVIGEQLTAFAAGLWTTRGTDGDLILDAAYTRPGWGFAEDHEPGQIGSAIHEAITERKTVSRQWAAGDEALRSDDGTAAEEVYVWACPFAIEDRVLGILTVYTPKPLSSLSSSELSLVSIKLAQFIQRRANEQAQQESEELFRTLANSISQLAWMARPDGSIFWYNQRWYDYTGTTMDSMKGEDWQSVLDLGEAPQVLESIHHSFKTGEPWEETFLLRRHDGEFRWHLSQMLPVRDEQGRIRLWFGTNTDVTEQRNAETRLRRVIDSMFSFVGIVAEDGTLIEVNQAPLAAAGLTREQVIGRKFWDCHWWTHSETVRERIQQGFEQALRGELVRYDEEMRLEGDIRVIVDFMFQPVFDAGKLVFVIPSGVDVTARTRAEARLGASEEFLRSVLDALANHIAVLDEQGVILLVNRAWQQFANVNDLNSGNYGIGQNYLEACAPVTADCPSDAAVAAAGIRDVLSGNRPWFGMEYPCHSPTEKRWFQMRVDRITSLASTRVVVSHEDITSRVLSEEAIRRWSAQQERLAEIAVDLAAAENSEATLNFVTTGARKLIESAAAETIRVLHDDGEQIQRSVSCAADEDEIRWFSPVSTGIDPVRKQVRQSNRPLRVVSLDAPQFFAAAAPRVEDIVVLTSTLAAPLTARDGRNIGLIQLRGKLAGEFTPDDELILIQLAQMASVALERARLYDEIRDADQRKDQFLATLAHELRNPLSALTSGTQLILMRPEDTAHIVDTANLISRQCGHLKKLVDDLLDVSRISRGKINLQFAPTKLQDVVQQALETAQAIIEAAEHQLVTRLASKPLYVEGDAVRLAQVVSNLLVNAAKYTPSGGRIELELEERDNQAVIVVRDNGIGIPAEMAGRIFDLFAQVDGSHVRSQGGLGIGLTLARTLVAMHHGQIEVTSAGIDRGSTFIVRLPLTRVIDAETAESSPVNNAVSTTVTRRILVVDDNHAAVHLLSRLLTLLGHTVQTAADGQAALATIKAFQPEVVISDIGMPDMSGYELARYIQQMDVVTKPTLVALTGYGQESDRQAAFEAGFHHHLTKPVGLSDLQALLGSLPK